jgi:hypothetical protein
MVEHNSIRAVIFHDRTDPYLVPMETSQGFVNATYINNAGEKNTIVRKFIYFQLLFPLTFIVL